MFVTYAPEDPADGDRQEWTFKPGRVRASEAQVIQRQFGENWDSFALGVQSGDIHARRVLLWHLLRLEHPTLLFKDVRDFFTDELKVEFDSAELVPLVERMEKSSLPDDKKQQALAALDLALTEAMEREAAGREAGKAS